MGQKNNVASVSSMRGSNSRHSRRTYKKLAGFELIMAMVNDCLLKVERSRISPTADRPLKHIQSILIIFTAVHIFALLTIIVINDLHLPT